MKLIKVGVVSLICLLSACSFNISREDVDKAKDVFSEQLDNLYELYENNVKDIVSDFSVEKAEKTLNDIMSKIPEDKKSLVSDGIKKGITLIEDGKEILANELSMKVSLEGVQEEIEEFLTSLANIDARVSVGDVIK